MDGLHMQARALLKKVLYILAGHQICRRSWGREGGLNEILQPLGQDYGKGTPTSRLVTGIGG